MRRSTLIAIVLSWATYVVASLLAVDTAAQPRVDVTWLMVAISLGGLGLLLLHSWVVDRERHRGPG